MRICFFSKEGFESILKQQYSLQDINILRELGHDVVIASNFKEIPYNFDLYFSWWASGSILPLIKSIVSRKPIFVIAGGTEAMLIKDSVYENSWGFLETPLYKKIATILSLRFATKLFVVSDFMINDVKKLSRRNPIVLYNSVNTQIFKGDSDYIKEIIFTVVNLDEGPFLLKRGEIFLKAIKEVLKFYPDQKFAFVGKLGNAYQKYKMIVNKLKINENVELIHNIKNNDMPTMFQKAKGYVQLSDVETFGQAVAEAMSCSVPVIVSKRGFLPSLVGPKGIYVDHNDYLSVSESILFLLNKTDQERLQIGNQLRTRIKEKFSYQKRKTRLASIINNYFSTDLK